MRRFLWHGSQDRRLCAVSWERTILAKSRGGLGIGSITDKNKCLLFKWIWNFRRNSQGEWKSIYDIKYFDQNKCLVPALKSSNCSAVGRGIISQLYPDNYIVSGLGAGLKCVVGNGNRCSFWNDWWISDKRLAEKFPRLYSIALIQDCTISEMGSWSNNSWYWIFRWRRNLFEWEHNLELELLSILSEHQMKESIEDEVMWAFSTDGKYSVKSCSIYLEESKNISFPDHYSIIWKSKIPPRIQIFLWKLLQERIPTKSFLSRRSVHSLPNILCPFCESYDETTSHIMLHCKFAWTIWGQFMRWWGVQMVMPSSTAEALNCWLSYSYSKQNKEFLLVMLGAMCWTLWLERNKLIFDKRSIIWQNVFHLVLTRTSTWIAAVDPSFPFSINDLKVSTGRDLMMFRG